jgi:hypothetical protein
VTRRPGRRALPTRTGWTKPARSRARAEQSLLSIWHEVGGYAEPSGTTLKALTGRTESSCRAIVGRWLSLAHDNCIKISRLIEDAERDRVADPVAWIEARLKERRNGKRTNQDVRELAQSEAGPATIEPGS